MCAALTPPPLRPLQMGCRISQSHLPLLSHSKLRTLSKGNQSRQIGTPSLHRAWLPTIFPGLQKSPDMNGSPQHRADATKKAQSPTNSPTAL